MQSQLQIQIYSFSQNKLQRIQKRVHSFGMKIARIDNDHSFIPQIQYTRICICFELQKRILQLIF